MRKGGEEVTLAIRDEISRLELDQQIHRHGLGVMEDAKMHVWLLLIQREIGIEDSPEIGRQIVRDIQGHSLESYKIYHFVNGEMMPNLDISAPVGISKKKESPVTNE